MASPGYVPPWWRNRWLLAALCLATALPVLVTSVPPLVDYLGHLGRYRIQTGLATSPLLQANWDFHWALVANLGVDLLIEPLSHLFGLERAGWLIALAIPPLFALGLIRTARAAHGAVPGTALAALPFALAYPYQFGFLNYWLGTALAFNFFAFWLAGIGAPMTPRRAALFVPAALLTWITHAFGWGILGVLAGGAEIGRAWQAGERRIAGLLVRPALRCWPLAAPLPLMLIWRAEGEGAETLGWFRLASKISDVTRVLRDQSMTLDIASVAAALLLLYFVLRSRRLGFAPVLAVPALILFGLGLLFPYQLFGSAYADTRIWPVAIATALLAIHTGPEGAKLAARIAIAALALFAVRIAATTAGFAAYDREIGRHLAALDEIEPGSRVALLVRWPCEQPWRAHRLQHIGSMAIIRRDAFTNSQWNVPGAQLLTPLGGEGTPFNADPSQFVGDRSCPADLRPLFYERVAAIPRDRFDYVWAIDFAPQSLRPIPGLTPRYSDERTILYRIERTSAP